MNKLSTLKKSNGKKAHLEGKKIAILLGDGFEESEMTKPRDALKKQHATVHLVTPKSNTIKAWHHDKWGKKYKADIKLEKAKAAKYDALILPGGVMNPDTLRTNKAAIAFIKQFIKDKKPIAAICHGPWSLVETGKLKGRHLTSYHSIKTDLINAGAKWENKKVVVDKNLITSRSPKDLKAFNKAIINMLSSK